MWELDDNCCGIDDDIIHDKPDDGSDDDNRDIYIGIPADRW